MRPNLEVATAIRAVAEQVVIEVDRVIEVDTSADDEIDGVTLLVKLKIAGLEGLSPSKCGEGIDLQGRSAAYGYIAGRPEQHRVFPLAPQSGGVIHSGQEVRPLFGHGRHRM